MEIHQVFSTRPKLARIVLTQWAPLAGAFTAKRGWSKTGPETGVARYRKIGGSLEESARGAQRGLLVILTTALIWLLAIWAGYHLL